LGEILLTQKAPAEAELWFARSLSIDTVSSAAYDGLVRAQLEQSDTLSARTTLGRWSESVRDTTGRAWFTLAGLWERAGALEPARRSVETGLAFQPTNVEGWLRLARLAQLRGDDATAVAVLRQATERLPTEKRVWRSLGLAAMRGNDLVMAWEGLRTAYTLGDSDCVPSLRSLQGWHQTRGENAQAERIAHLLDGK
jgi:Flp pilus assembly protein TadD